jgi:hypothetical protein
MSGPVPVGCAANGDHTERKKDRAENNVIFNPSDASEEERKGGEQSKAARFGVHFRSQLERGSDQAAPLARVDGLEPQTMKARPASETAGHLSGSDRAARYPTVRNPPPRGCLRR